VSTIARFSTRYARPFRTGLAALGLAAALAGCAGGSKWGFPYKIDVQQGNWITQEQVALLQPGMSREQVRFALGSPTLTSVLHADRWDYPYYFKPGYGDARERKFTVWFENDKLVRWEGDQQPELQPYQLDKAADGQDEAGKPAQAEGTPAPAEGGTPPPADGDKPAPPANVTVTPPPSPATQAPGQPGDSAEPLK